MKYYILVGVCYIMPRFVKGKTYDVGYERRQRNKKLKPRGPRLPFTRANMKKVPNEPGVYSFFDANNKKIYVGRAGEGKYAGLRHRVGSYIQKDDFAVNRTKDELRPNIARFSFQVIPDKKFRRKLEKKMKSGLRFNHR